MDNILRLKLELALIQKKHQLIREYQDALVALKKETKPEIIRFVERSDEGDESITNELDLMDIDQLQELCSYINSVMELRTSLALCFRELELIKKLYKVRSLAIHFGLKP